MFERMKEWLAIKVAWMLPRRLVMWCYFRVAAHATQGQWGHECPDQVDIMTAVGRWK
jgi:hypothetical protein